MAAAPHEFSSRRDEMFMARDGPKIFSPLGSGHFREAMLLLLHRAITFRSSGAGSESQTFRGVRNHC